MTCLHRPDSRAYYETVACYTNMRRRYLIGILVLAGCAAHDPKLGTVKPSLAQRKHHDLTVELVDNEPTPAFYKVRSADGREWHIPTAGYQPNKVGVDGALMKDYVGLHQLFSPSREIIGFNEGGDLHSHRLLFISGPTAHLFAITSGVRDRRHLRPSELMWYYQYPLDEIRDDGVVMERAFYKWNQLKLEKVGTFTAVDTRVAPPAS